MGLPTLSWTDAIGAAAITTPANRLGDWTPDVNIIGDDATPLGTGVVQNYVHRLDYVVAFEMQELDRSLLPLFLRLKLWLSSGGTVTIYTGDDSDAQTYACTMWEKKPPTWTFDRTNYVYTLKVSLRSSQAIVESGAAVGSPSITVTPNPILLTTT